MYDTEETVLDELSTLRHRRAKSGMTNEKKKKRLLREIDGYRLQIAWLSIYDPNGDLKKVRNDYNALMNNLKTVLR